MAGIDVGRVVDDKVFHDNAAAVDAVGVGWVRLNLRLDSWTSPTDPGWFETYDRVVDDYLARGITVYALINDEATGSTQPHGSDAWIADFVGDAVTIIDHFKNRIRVFEIINEPNDWAGGTSARFTPHQFAKILQDTYLAVKHDGGHAGDRCWDVTLVSGPLFSFDGTTAAQYLADTYTAGRTQLAWDYTRMVTGSFPLDGVGYHLYVAQGPDSSTADVRTQTLANVNAIGSVITARDPGKQIWVSEYGWEAEVVGEAGQAERLAAGFGAMADSGHVALALYFNYQDFPGASYGIVDGAAQPRTSAAMLGSLSGLPRRARNVAIAASEVAPGELGEVTVTVRNDGTTAWDAGVRLAAAPGCPDATEPNAIAWEPADGYANGLADARVFLPHAVAPGESVELRVPIRAPAGEGDYRFAARLVDEGVAFFGPTVAATVSVRARPAPPPSDGDHAAGDRAGCGAGGPGGLGTAWFVALALLAARRRWAC